MEPNIIPPKRHTPLLDGTLKNVFFPPERGEYQYFARAAEQPFSKGEPNVKAAWAADAAMLCYARYGLRRMTDAEFEDNLSPGGLTLRAKIGEDPNDMADKQSADGFSDEDVAVAEAVACAAGIAIENNRLHDEVESLSILDDRDRIAHDLHDRVIQRIFGVGMTLQGVTRLDDLPQMIERVSRAVDDLDGTITEIRTVESELDNVAALEGLRQSVPHPVGARPDVRKPDRRQLPPVD